MDEHTKKYELIDVGDDYIGNRKVYRIKALHDFESAKKGDLGGYVESEENLSHSGRCWVYDNAYVVDKARVYEDATIRGSVWIFDNAEVFGRASISGQARVFHYAKVYDNVISIVQHFSSIGYRVALIGKQHYAPEASFPFEYDEERRSKLFE